MKYVLKNPTPKQQELLDFLEKNKDSNSDVEINSYAAPLVRFVDYLQGDVTEIDDDQEYVAFQALRYDCFNSFNLTTNDC